MTVKNSAYRNIKRLPREMRAEGGSVRANDLVALATNNDPFYVGTPRDVGNAEWFAGREHEGVRKPEKARQVDRFHRDTVAGSGEEDEECEQQGK